jgi:O-antigen/teichoic acid export membrane protein
MTVEKVGSAMSWNLLAKVARFVAMPVGYAVIVRSLGEYDWGLLNLLRTITAFVLVAVIAGGGNTILRYLPQARVRGGMRSLMRDVGRLIAIQAAVWLALTAAAWYLSGPIAGIYHQDDARFAYYLVLAVGFVAFEASMTMVTNILQSWYETRLLGIVIVAGNIAYVILLIVVLRLGWGIPGVFAAGGAVNLVSTLALIPQAVELVRSHPEDSVPGPGMGVLMRFSIPFVAIGLLNQIVWRHSEVLLLGHFTGIEASGFFGLAYRIPQMALEFIPLSIWPVVMAGVSESYAKDPGRLPGTIDIYYRLLFLLVLPVAALGFAFSRPLVPLLFGRGMEPAALLTQLFFVVFSYSFIYTPLSMALYVVGKSWINMLVFAVLAVVNLGLDLAFIPRFGLWGAFAPVAVTLLVGIAAFRIAAGRAGTGISVPAGFIARCYLAVTPTALLALSASRWHEPAALAAQALAGVLLLWGGIRLTRIVGEREKELILRLPIPAKELIVSLL